MRYLILVLLLAACGESTTNIETCVIVPTHDRPALAPVPDSTLAPDTLYADKACVGE